MTCTNDEVDNDVIEVVSVSSDSDVVPCVPSHRNAVEAMEVLYVWLFLSTILYPENKCMYGKSHHSQFRQKKFEVVRQKKRTWTTTFGTLLDTKFSVKVGSDPRDTHLEQASISFVIHGGR